MIEPISFLDGKVILYPGDCMEALTQIPENYFDAVCCDPPYHLQSIVKRFGSDSAAPAKSCKTGAFKRASAGFMGKQWDGGDIAFRKETWEAVYRVLKPGAYIVAFSSTRTFGRMQVALEDAGFITHPFIAWIFGQGFPKAHRVNDPEWEGWRYGTQSLKPAIEPIYVGQKPFEKGLTGTQNVQRWRTGALNIDGCRVPTEESTVRADCAQMFSKNGKRDDTGRPALNRSSTGSDTGRWPANVLTDGSPEVVGCFPNLGKGSGVGRAKRERGTRPGGFGNVGHESGSDAPNAAVYSDSGSAARFFYSAKADDTDRVGSKHPTVKPVDLKQYLCRLITPPGGLILDLFAGTGTTGEAAWREGFRAILIEREPEYQADIARRMKLCLAGPEERQRESIKASGKAPSPESLPLFGGAT